MLFVMLEILNAKFSEYVTYTSHLLTTVNGSVNVFIYFVKHIKGVSSYTITSFLGTRGGRQGNIK